MAEYTDSQFVGAMKSLGGIAGFFQSVEKLAVLPLNLYIDHDFGGVEWPPRRYLKTQISSLSGGEKPATQALQRIAGRFGRATKLVGGSLLVGSSLAMPALAKDSSTQSTPAPIPAVAIQNPYIAACENHDIAEYEAACRDAANGTVVVLRNPNEVSDIARDIFLGTMERIHGDSIPVEVRETAGSTRIFVFDKNMQISSSALTNGSLVSALGIRYPEKVAALRLEL